MKKHLITTLIATALLTSGCQTFLYAKLNLSQVKGEPFVSIGNMAIEVAACHDYEDSRLPSDALTQAKEVAASIIKAAEFIDCHSEQMNSYAMFNIPVGIDTREDQKHPTDDSLNIFISDDGSIALSFPETIAGKIKSQIEQGNLVLDETVFQMDVINDTDQTFYFRSRNSYVNGQPAITATFTVAPGQSFKIKPSNVSFEMSLSGLPPTLLEIVSKEDI